MRVGGYSRLRSERVSTALALAEVLLLKQSYAINPSWRSRVTSVGTVWRFCVTSVEGPRDFDLVYRAPSRRSASVLGQAVVAFSSDVACYAMEAIQVHVRFTEQA